MQLRGQQRGYAMAALLVGLGVMSVMLTVAMPVWTQMSRREKEAELVFRGEQYKRALELFQRRNGPGVAPPNVEALIEGRFLRKQFKDPVTNTDFLLLRQGVANETPAPGAQQSGPAGTALQTGRGGGGAPAGSPAPGFAAGGIIGVASRSTEQSLRIYNGRTQYNEWDFTFVQQTQAPGGGPGAGGGPGGPPGAPGAGGRGQGPGRGIQPDGFDPREPGSNGVSGRGRGAPPTQQPGGRPGG